MTTAIETRRFDKPDDLLDMKECGGIAIVKMGTGATGWRACGGLIAGHCP